MNLYVYCVGEEGAAALLEGREGVDGVRTRVLREAGMAAVVSESEGERVAATRENIMAHNGVAASVLAETTPLPFRFGIVTGEERLRQYMAENRESLLASLERVRGCVEMSVKIMWDGEARCVEASARGGQERRGSDVLPGQTADALPEQAAGGRRVEMQATEGRGTAYLSARRRELARGAALKEGAEGIAAWLSGVVGDAARDVRVALQPEAALVLRAAHLVERARLADYRGRVSRAREEGGGRGLRFLTSGVWPPYSFSQSPSEVVDMRRKFGVLL